MKNQKQLLHSHVFIIFTRMKQNGISSLKKGGFDQKTFEKNSSAEAYVKEMTKTFDDAQDVVDLKIGEGSVSTNSK
jgi:hypothetical protein